VPREPPHRLAPVEFEPRLVETVVRVVLDRGAKGVAPAALTRLRLSHRRRLDDIYAEPPGEAREGAFRDHYRKLFGFLGFDRRVEELLAVFPRLRRELREVLVRSAAPPEGEGAELWESRRQRGQGVPAYLVVSLAPRRFTRPSELTGLMLPRLQRAADLLDPDFGAGAAGTPASQRAHGAPDASQAVRDTYQKLWDLSARARLVASGELEDAGLASEVAAMAAVDGRDADGLLELLGSADRVSGPRLLALAEELAAAAVDEAEPGERCPLCSFPTLVWASAEAVSDLRRVIQEEYPGWQSSDGCCEHCADRYIGLAALAC